ncbi:MAG: MFS transporter [Herpetosiphonaceae bacterium]|nr:MAG: MFS transporter [Herpetosiphonaceae bacterium]
MEHPRIYTRQLGTKREWPHTFRALRHRNYRLLWFGQLVSLVGTWMQSLAQQWLVYKLTGQAFNLGLVSAMMFLPVLILAPFAGVLADRVDKRRLIVATQMTAMAQAFVLAALAFSGLIQFWHILAMAAVLGIINAIDMPARQSFVPEVVEDHEDLMNAIALNSMVFNGARAIGPAVAGILVGAVGEAWAFTVNGASYLAVISGLLLMRMPPREQKEDRTTSAGRDLLDGLRYALSTPAIRTVLTLVMVPSVFGISYITLLPIFANEVLSTQGVPWLEDGARRLGLLMTAQGFGALLGALNIARSGHRRRKGQLLLGGALGFSLMLILFSLSRFFWLSLVLVAVAGFMMITFLATANTTLQSTVSSRFRGRVMSFYTMVLVGFGLIGSLLAGAAADWLGAPLATRIGALICLAGALIAAQSPLLRRDL